MFQKKKKKNKDRLEISNEHSLYSENTFNLKISNFLDQTTLKPHKVTTIIISGNLIWYLYSRRYCKIYKYLLEIPILFRFDFLNPYIRHFNCLSERATKLYKDPTFQIIIK